METERNSFQTNETTQFQGGQKNSDESENGDTKNAMDLNPKCVAQSRTSRKKEEK